MKLQLCYVTVYRYVMYHVFAPQASHTVEHGHGMNRVYCSLQERVYSKKARRGQGGRLTTLNFRPGAVTTLNFFHVLIFYQVIFPVNKQGSIESPLRKQHPETDTRKRERETNTCSKKQLVIMQTVIGTHCKNFTGSN